LKEEIEKRIEFLNKEIEEKEKERFLNGKYDKNSAILTITRGAGGREAEDWVAMLKRMYERYALKKGFLPKVLDIHYTEAGGPKGRIGIRNVSLEIKGKYAYGLLKNESGVHRLVRISPFSPQKLRHTSFALVEVIPVIESQKEIKIRPEEIKIDFYRASGPGGQYVNRRETAVRITHLKTGIVVSCQSERNQGKNREIAMKMLISKLIQLEEKKKEKEIFKLKGKPVSIEWGNQIRSYVLDPYKLVKDLRTKIETPLVDEVLDGELDKFIEAEIYLKNS
jgi:peptide chain release factor 2